MPHPLLGECLGTAVLIIFGNGVVANANLKKTYGENAGFFAVTTGWFIGVMMGVFVAQSLGSMQADLNPAITLAKTYLGLYSFTHMWQTMLCQLLGAAIGSVLVWLAYLPHWSLTIDSTTLRNCFCTSPAIRRIPSNMLSEVIGTVVLVIGVGAIFGHATLGHPVDGLGPYLVGALVWGIGLSLGGATGYAINPARDLGPRMVFAILPIKHKGTADWSYAFVPVVSPFIGAVLAAIFWKSVLLS